MRTAAAGSRIDLERLTARVNSMPRYVYGQAQQTGEWPGAPSSRGLFSPMTSLTKCPETSFTLRRERSERGSVRRDAVETMDVREQRVKFVVAASRREKPFNHVCLEFGVSRPTGQFILREKNTGKLIAFLKPMDTDGNTPRLKVLHEYPSVVRFAAEQP